MYVTPASMGDALTLVVEYFIYEKTTISTEKYCLYLGPIT
jgi:hypothetical protein